MSTPENTSAHDDSTEGGDSVEEENPSGSGESPPGNSTETDPPRGSILGEEDAGSVAPRDPTVEPITDEEWNRLRAPFCRSAYVIDARAIGRTEATLGIGEKSEDASQGKGSNQVVADLRLRAKVIRDRLDWVLGPQRYSYRLELAPDGNAEHSVLCHLQIGRASRTGIGTGSSYRAARKVALAGAALAFGIGASGKTSGPTIVGRKSRYDVPASVLDALEAREDPSPWTPEEPSGASRRLRL